MSIKKDGIMVILSSPSGAGKTTLVKLLSKNKNFKISISHTTRKPRQNEVQNKDYYFVDDDKFNELIQKGEFLEHAKVFNNLYGTSRSNIIRELNQGENIIFDIDWQGADQIKNQKLKYKLVTFFVLPPSKEILFERLSNRDMKDKLIVEERMKEFGRDVLHWINYDYVIINDDLDKCYSRINELIESEKKNISNDYNKEQIRKHINFLTS